MSWEIRNVIVYVLDFIMGVIAFFIGLRFILNLVSANPSTPFVAWINTISSSLIYPFAGIVPNFQLGTGVFDLVAMVSLLAYAIIFYLLTVAVESVLPVRRVITESHEHMV